MRKLRHLEYLVIMFAGFFLWAVSARHLTGRFVPIGWLEFCGMIFGVVLIAWHLLKLLKSLSREASNFIILKSETGSVRVHASAIEEALRHTARSLPEVHDIHVRLVIDKQTRLPSAGEVDARVKDITNIVRVHDTLSRVLCQRYEQIIPGAPPIEFHLAIKYHEKPPSKHKRGRTVPPEEDETKAVRAPLYPVPD